MSSTEVAPTRPTVALPRSGPTLVAMGVAAAVLVLLWVVVVGGTLFAALDPVADGWLVTIRPAASVEIARTISDAGQPAVMITVLVLATVIVAARSRSWAPVGVSAGALMLLGLLDNGVKAVVARPRPPVTWHATTVHGSSFPSGHALWSAGVALLVVVLAGPGRRRAVLVVVGAVVVVAVGGARLLLAVHYPSDVLAGWSLAVLADGVVILLAARLLAHLPPSGAVEGSAALARRIDRRGRERAATVARMSRTAQWVTGAVVLLVLVAAAVYSAMQRDTGITVVLVAVILVGAVALSVLVSRKQS